MKNYGIDITKERFEQSEKDWVFGAESLVCIAEIPEDERLERLPKGEVQKGREDMMDCATRGPLNILETKFNWLLKNKKLDLKVENFFRDNGYITENGFEFSDAFIAILSGTTRQGNSIKAPLDAIRKYGLIPKRMLPLNPNMTFDEYHNPDRITGSMRALGQNFLRHISINYEKVYEPKFEEMLKRDMINVAGYAWSIPLNGEYPRIEAEPNHVWVNFKNKYWAFDNYIDPVDGDFIKKLTTDYDFYEYGYRIIISMKKEETLNWIEQMIKIIKEALGLIQKEVDIVAPKPPKEPTMNKSRLDDFCLAIRDYEGQPGDLNYRNNNPGNCRCSKIGYRDIYGDVKCVNRFAVFPTYEQGYLYLKNFVSSKINANPKWTTLDYISKVHAPAEDNNNPKKYAEYICKRLDIPMNTKLKDIF